jgi:hypothetical protein
MTQRRVETVTSSDIRAVFENWLASECRAGARLIVLEGLTGSGKSHLTEPPFAIGTTQSTNIEIDKFLRAPVPPTVPYPDGLIGRHCTRDRIRRVYLKRMMRLKPSLRLCAGVCKACETAMPAVRVFHSCTGPGLENRKRKKKKRQTGIVRAER